MDRAYVDFARLHRLHLAGAFFVTWAKKNLHLGVRERRPISGDGVLSDRLIRLRGHKNRTRFPDTLRLIRYVDPETKKRLRFLTNNLTLDALTISLLHRRRWRIERFFKWIKQPLHVKAFYGLSPNAVQTQLWVAVMDYVLLVRLKHRHGLSQSLNGIFQILSVTIWEKTPVFELFSEIIPLNPEGEKHKQFTLFEI